MGIYWMGFAKKARQCFDVNKVRRGLPGGRWEPTAYWRGWLDAVPDEQRCGGLTRLAWFLAQHPDDEIMFDFDENEPKCSYDVKREGGYVEQHGPWDGEVAK